MKLLVFFYTIVYKFTYCSENKNRINLFIFCWSSTDAFSAFFLSSELETSLAQSQQGLSFRTWSPFGPLADEHRSFERSHLWIRKFLVSPVIHRDKNVYLRILRKQDRTWFTWDLGLGLAVCFVLWDKCLTPTILSNTSQVHSWNPFLIQVLASAQIWQWLIDWLTALRHISTKKGYYCLHEVY